MNDVSIPSDIFGGAAEVSAGDVASALGFGGVNDLLKAMTVGDQFPATVGELSPGALMATVPQDLDDVLHNAAFTDRQLILYNKLKTTKVWSTVHQYVRKHSPGSAGKRFMFHREGGLPVESDSTYSLESLAMKYLGAVRRLPIQARLVKSVAGDAVKNQNKDGALEILASLEWHLFYGNSRTNPLAFDGIKATMIREGINMDARGATPTEGMLDELMTKITDRPNFGYPTDLLSSPAINRTLRQTYAGRVRSMMGDKFHPNYVLRGMTYDHCQEDDEVTIHKHPLVIEESGLPDERGAGPDPSSRPVEPIIVTQPTAGAAGANTSRFINADAGSYYFRVVALNGAGMSKPVTTQVVAVAAGQVISIVLRDGAVPGSKQAATAYMIYRTEVGGAATTAKQIDEIAVAANNADTTFIDCNDNLPGTSDIFVLSNDPEAIEIKQLLPFFNFPLGNLDTSYRWALLMFMALKIALPRKHGILRNVRPDAGLIQVVGSGDQSAPQRHV